MTASQYLAAWLYIAGNPASMALTILSPMLFVACGCRVFIACFRNSDK